LETSRAIKVVGKPWSFLQFTCVGNDLFCLDLRREPQIARCKLIPVDATAHYWLAQRFPSHIKYADGLVRLSKSPS